MVQSVTKLNVIDNSGVSTVLCIHILRRKERMAKIGDQLVVSVRSVVIHKHINPGVVLLALVVRKKKWTYRSNGVNIAFKHNGVVLIDPKTKNLLGTRIRGPVPQELRRKHYLRIVCLASTVI